MKIQPECFGDVLKKSQQTQKENDGAREGIIICMERLMTIGIPLNNIFMYDLALLLSSGYKGTYSSYIKNILAQLRLMCAEELNQYDIIVFAVEMPERF